jgi:hypothetical protein
MLVNMGGRTRYRVFKNIFVTLEIKADNCVCVWGGGIPACFLYRFTQLKHIEADPSCRAVWFCGRTPTGI